MFSKYRSFSSPSMSNTNTHTNTNSYSAELLASDTQTNINEKQSTETNDRIKIALNTYQKRVSFIEPTPFVHCLKKRKSILVHSLMYELINECCIETHNILNKNYTSLQDSCSKVLDNIREYSSRRFNNELKGDLSSIKTLITELIEELVTNGNDTTKIRIITNGRYNSIVRCIASIV